MQLLRITLALIFLTQIGHAQSYYRNWKVRRDTNKERIALIIANNSYVSSGRLVQPIPTAKKLEAKLSNLGFDVLVGRDLKRKQMVSVLGDFANKFRGYKFALIVYMGHGFEIDGKNYLIPIDADPPSKDEVALHAIDMEYVLKKVNNAKIPKVIILDACRNNPFKKHWTASQRSSVGEGFADLDAPLNAEIFFTTQKNSMVKDQNPYIEYFMDEIGNKGCLDGIVRNISKRIYNYDPTQIPAKYGQLLDEVCFGKRAKPNPYVEPRPKPKPLPVPDNNEVIINGQTYKTVTIGNQTWLAENLNAYIDGSSCYDNNASNCRQYGRLYSWAAAKKIADQTPGWHLPTDEEWTTLTNYLGNNAGTKLKQNGDSGFNALLAGNCCVPTPFGEVFDNFGNGGHFWSASPRDSNYVWYRLVHASYSTVYRYADPMFKFLSVRLLKDD